jgi:hypothetical protein
MEAAAVIAETFYPAQVLRRLRATAQVAPRVRRARSEPRQGWCKECGKNSRTPFCSQTCRREYLDGVIAEVG